MANPYFWEELGKALGIGLSTAAELKIREAAEKRRMQREEQEFMRRLILQSIMQEKAEKREMERQRDLLERQAQYNKLAIDRGMLMDAVKQKYNTKADVRAVKESIGMLKDVPEDEKQAVLKQLDIIESNVPFEDQAQLMQYSNISEQLADIQKNSLRLFNNPNYVPKDYYELNIKSMPEHIKRLLGADKLVPYSDELALLRKTNPVAYSEITMKLSRGVEKTDALSMKDYKEAAKISINSIKDQIEVIDKRKSELMKQKELAAKDADRKLIDAKISIQNAIQQYLKNTHTNISMAVALNDPEAIKAALEASDVGDLAVHLVSHLPEMSSPFLPYVRDFLNDRSKVLTPEFFEREGIRGLQLKGALDRKTSLKVLMRSLFGGFWTDDLNNFYYQSEQIGTDVERYKVSPKMLKNIEKVKSDYKRLMSAVEMLPYHVGEILKGYSYALYDPATGRPLYSDEQMDKMREELFETIRENVGAGFAYDVTTLADIVNTLDNEWYVSILEEEKRLRRMKASQQEGVSSTEKKKKEESVVTPTRPLSIF